MVSEVPPPLTLKNSEENLIKDAESLKGGVCNTLGKLNINKHGEMLV